MEKEKADDRPSVSLLFYDFLGYTTVHGAGRVVASGHWIRKLCWGLLILGTLGFLTMQIPNLYQMYRERPLATRVAIEHDTSLNFPSITICDMNPLRKDDVQEYLPESLKNILESGAEEDDENEEKEEKEKQEEKEEEEDEDEDGDPGTLEKEYLNREFLRMEISKYKVHDLMGVGHQFEDFVVHCTFKGVFCGNYSSSFWSRFWHYAYGNCFVFNGGKPETGRNAKIFKSNQPGPLHGLSLELNIERGQYIGGITEEAGVRVDISNQGEMPFPFEKGLSIAPGYATSIGLRKVVIKRMDPLSRNRCMENSSLDNANIYKKPLQVNYSSLACKGSCLAYHQLQKCGCMHYRFPRPPGTKVCDVLNKTEARCVSKVQTDFTDNNLNCSESCPPLCSESTFKLTTSYSIWPTKSYEDIYKIALKERKKEVDGSDDLRDNVLKLNIFFEELNYEVISEEPSYKLANFVSDLGGSLGFWIGMSVLSFVEILELLLLTCYTLGKKFMQRITSGGKVEAFTG
ncbi:ligand-gated sodium channel [Porites harrisoni]